MFKGGVELGSADVDASGVELRVVKSAIELPVVVDKDGSLVKNGVVGVGDL